MAKGVLSPLFTSLRGKLGNSITQLWKGIQIVRAMPSVISQPSSTRQVAIRQQIQAASVAWNNLSTPNKNSWEEMALLVKDYELPPGGSYSLIPSLGGPQSGFNCFVSFYMSAVDAEHPALSGPAPLSEERPDAPSALTAAYVTPTFTVTWADPVASDAGAKVRIWLKSRRRIYHTQRRAVVALAVQTLDMTSAYSGGGNLVNFTIPETAGLERVYVRMDTVNPSGLRSQPSTIVSAVLT